MRDQQFSTKGGVCSDAVPGMELRALCMQIMSTSSFSFLHNSVILSSIWKIQFRSVEKSWFKFFCLPLMLIYSIKSRTIKIILLLLSDSYHNIIECIIVHIIKDSTVFKAHASHVLKLGSTLGSTWSSEHHWVQLWRAPGPPRWHVCQRTNILRKMGRPSR